MPSLPRLLVSVENETVEIRWRLVSTLFGKTRALFEGSISQIAVLVLCLVRTGWPGFGVLTIASCIVFAGRWYLFYQFDRRLIDAKLAARPPEFWVGCFVTGITAASSIWGAAMLFSCLLFDDVKMQMIVITIQAGWISGSVVRSPASPAAIASQVASTMLPGMIGAAFSPTHFLHLLTPFFLLQAGPVMSVAKYLGAQLATLIASEQRLEVANAQLLMLSSTDGLTGIGNRRAFDAVLQIEWARAAREGTDLALLIIDVDHFKWYNDRYGHPAGDACLRHIAETIESTLRRPPDFAGRFGGEEFVCVLPGTHEAGARDVAERLRLGVMKSAIAHEASPFAVVTVSVGVASLWPQPGGDQQDLITLADKALYAAKESGRNRVCGAGLAGWTQLPVDSEVIGLPAPMEV